MARRMFNTDWTFDSFINQHRGRKTARAWKFIDNGSQCQGKFAKFFCHRFSRPSVYFYRFHDRINVVKRRCAASCRPVERFTRRYRRRIAFISSGASRTGDDGFRRFFVGHWYNLGIFLQLEEEPMHSILAPCRSCSIYWSRWRSVAKPSPWTWWILATFYILHFNQK